MTSRTPLRRSRRRPLAAAVGTLAVLTSLAWPPGLAVADAPSSADDAHPAPADTGQHTVTLLSGDVVRLTDLGGGNQTADVTRPPGDRITQEAIRAYGLK
ncbi:hypothetical protein [Streptomyces sp. NPDC060027]|uniref:hypothetical protein n=1 Tax=Streptomyces sp. NPDC060027 TaxID=3347040 RepID=UPI0036CFFD17